MIDINVLAVVKWFFLLKQAYSHSCTFGLAWNANIYYLNNPIHCVKSYAKYTSLNDHFMPSCSIPDFRGNNRDF